MPEKVYSRSGIIAWNEEPASRVEASIGLGGPSLIRKVGDGDLSVVVSCSDRCPTPPWKGSPSSTLWRVPPALGSRRQSPGSSCISWAIEICSTCADSLTDCTTSGLEVLEDGESRPLMLPNRESGLPFVFAASSGGTSTLTTGTSISSDVSSEGCPRMSADVCHAVREVCPRLSTVGVSGGTQSKLGSPTGSNQRR